MTKIKGWKKVRDRRKVVTWKQGITEAEIYPTSIKGDVWWRILITDNGVRRRSLELNPWRFSKTKGEARKAVISWMRRHPNG